MSTIRERLEKGVAMLEWLDRRRRETRSPRWGYDTEYLIISRELRQIENEILNESRDRPNTNVLPIRRGNGPHNQI
jgi:hypothetical protein